MEKIEQIRLLKELMRHRDNDTNVDVGGPVLAVRDDDGKFRAFANTCRHSGVVLEDRDRNAQCYDVFGRNEPALHHDHNTYREALGMEPLELIRD